MTPKLIVQHSSVKKLSIEDCSFHDIYGIEYAQARACLGFDLWTSMIALLADYTDEPEYDPESTYDQDEIVFYDGIYYISLQDANNAQPPQLEYWEAAPIFDTSATCGQEYQDLFCPILATYLANTMLWKRLPFMDVVEYKDKKVEKTDANGIQTIYMAVARDRAQAWTNLVHYMGTDTSKALYDTCFSGWKGAKDDDCNLNLICSPRKMRVGLYDFG